MSEQSSKLIIVESPAKAKTIGKFLGPGFVVRSSMGHIRDLPEGKLGVDIENKFNPTYVIPPEKVRFVKELTNYVNKAGIVYLATDEDREGEAIGWHIANATQAPPEKLQRIVFHEITKGAIDAALHNPRQLDMSLVNAQQARRILDRLVGYKISPLLGKGLSAGRVQSIALRFIVEREREIENFKPQEYWVIKAELQKKGPSLKFLATLIGFKDKKIEKMDIGNKNDAEKIVTALQQAQYQVEKITRKEVKRNPSPPFITSTLQQEAFRKLGFSVDRTMRIAQQLYEGIDLKVKGFSGLITYMRTDSFNISKEAQEESAAFVKQQYGDKYLPESPRIYKTVKGAQEAHEAIRPTSARNIPEEIKNFLTPDQYKVYNLIWQRFVASQMASAIMDSVSVDIRTNNEYLFRATGQTVKFDGFMVLYIEEEEEEDTEKKKTNEESKAKLPALTEKEILELVRLLSDQKFTEPPPRFNEASLIKILEKYGIGRPSTYAPIINTIKARKYVKIKEHKFYPEPIGYHVNDLLKENFSSVIDVGFTARMEEELDEIAEGKQEWTTVLQDFYASFNETLKNAEETISKGEKTDRLCPLDKAPLVMRFSRYGKFIACSNFPKCKYKEHIEEGVPKQAAETTNQKCPVCSLPLVIRSGRKGKFLACSGYPKCRYTSNLDGTNQNTGPEMTTEICEKCGKPMVIRTSQRGKFLACSGFPKCKNTKSIEQP
ncbi:MAG: type I DNA topoisomerase [bacterium]|nr:type I DNA topoisomerase [bacterium]MDD5354239.1 type I DNA topoisomerase [bacterium]